MNLDQFSLWVTSGCMGEPQLVMTQFGTLNLTKARSLADQGELTLVPLRTGTTGMREIRFNALLYDILTENGFRLDLLTGEYRNHANPV